MGGCDGRRQATGNYLLKKSGDNWINNIVILYQERSRAMNKGRIKKLTALIMSGTALIALISYFIISSVSSDSNSSAREDIKGTVNELSVNDADRSASGGSSVSVNETDPNVKKDPVITADDRSEVGFGASTEATTRSMGGSTTEKTTKETTTERIASGSTTEKTAKDPITEATTISTSGSATGNTTENTTKSATEVTTENTTKIEAEKPTEKNTMETAVVTNVTTEAISEKTTQAITEATTRTATESTTEKTTKTTTESTTEGTTSHTHTWVWKTQTETIHHEAVTHEVPVYDYDWSDPDICGVVWNGEVVTGYPIYEDKIKCGICMNYYDTFEEFESGCGHRGSWCSEPVLVNVIPAEKIIVDYETIVDQEAYDEEVEVNDYQYCSECGQRK